ncbi:hypothetical protein SLNWT_2057 [Streptomyces albus]|uniref:Uncharacterized protein n=1 Tax=Streptomyces albus (strain ATCC 21838 / DSM 41398 / FERM P-419 / JCM 4703 / NBRC 107858) TaxID=1081613 RepID=A0A0B5EJK0_STRA4|nr:hypothetical protein SLNWT_2057 [Streptomyces albus]AOU76746.1 hypothetical protein SLNHY_2055 [Streptomyces albus]AYN32528.1 hypothetical protein DUI70_2023 [Streptomyces albus]
MSAARAAGTVLFAADASFASVASAALFAVLFGPCAALAVAFGPGALRSCRVRFAAGAAAGFAAGRAAGFGFLLTPAG